MSTEEQRAKGLVDDLTSNDDTYEDQMNSLYQMIKLSELSGSADASFKPLLSIIDESSRYFKTAGELIKGSVGNDKKKGVAQERMRMKYGTDIKAVMRLAEDLKKQDELREFKALMDDAEVDDKLKAKQITGGIRSAVFSP